MKILPNSPARNYIVLSVSCNCKLTVKLCLISFLLPKYYFVHCKYNMWHQLSKTNVKQSHNLWFQLVYLQ